MYTGKEKSLIHLHTLHCVLYFRITLAKTLTLKHVSATAASAQFVELMDNFLAP